MGVVKTVVSQALCVAKTLEDGVHKALVKEREKYLYLYIYYKNHTVCVLAELVTKQVTR